MALFIDGIQLSQGSEPLRGDSLLFTIQMVNVKLSSSHSRGPYQKKLIMTSEMGGQKFSFWNKL